MPCSRCAGLTVPEVLRDGGHRVIAIRCVICGDVVDHVIVRHRTHAARPQLSRARTPIFDRKRNGRGKIRFTSNAHVPAL
jgi:uncharacterized Zn finger protein